MYLFAQADLEQQIASLATRTVTYAAIALLVLVITAAVVKKQPERVQRYFKLPLFVLIATIMVGSTLLLAGSTVYLNVKSESGGPVHWHSGIEFWACGAEVNLRDPNGFLSNKIGTATYHEHNDKYIHLEGVVVEKRVDASLEKFMEVTGGYIADDRIGIPLSEDESDWLARDDQLDGDPQRPENLGLATADGERIVYSSGTTDERLPVLELQNGQTCGSTTNEPAELQVFVYTFDKETDTYSQAKIEDPQSYIMRDESSLGPPSDCVIVEFDTPKAATDKLCEQYGVKDAQRCTEFGVKEYDPGLCNIKEINNAAGLPSAPEPSLEAYCRDYAVNNPTAGVPLECEGVYTNSTEEPCNGGDNPDKPWCNDTVEQQTPIESGAEPSAGTTAEEGGTE